MTIEIRKILCPVDFSDFSRRALDHALAIAEWYGARVTVLYVHPVPVTGPVVAFPFAPPSLDVPALSPADRQQLQQRLGSLVSAGVATTRPVECLVAEGDVAAEILAQAASADLVVIGSHGRSGFEHLMLGSVAEKVLRKAACPLLVVPRGASDAKAKVPGLFHEVVAAVDLSDASTGAVAFALSLAEEADARLTLVHALDLPLQVEAWVTESESGADRIDRWRQGALQRLRELVPNEARTYCHVEERVVVGQAYREILRVAADRHAGLIVAGAHARGPVERLFLGSTAQHLVRQAACPVLIVRNPDAKAH